MITPVLAQNAVTEVEVLLAVVEGIEVRFPVSRIHAYFPTSLIFDRRV